MDIRQYPTASTTLSSKSIKVNQAWNEIKSSTDGFVYLTYILHKNLPQFGGTPVQLNKELAKLSMKEGETLMEYHLRAVEIQQMLEFPNVTMNATIFLHTYLHNNLNDIPSIVTFLADFNRRFRRHLRVHGDNKAFPDSFTDIYEYLVDSKSPITLNLPTDHTTSMIIPSTLYGNRPMIVCKACFRRGLAFLPSSEAKRITRYNELNDDKSKVPKTHPLPRPSSPYHSSKSSQI